MTRLRNVTMWLCVVCAARLLLGAEPVTIENVADPGANRLDEPFSHEFSMDRAVRFLDSASLTWQKQRKCFTCHTNYAYLYARPLVSADNAAHREVRQFAEQLVAQRWTEKGPRWDAEVVATAAALAFNDAATGGELHKLTRVALDRMWTLQREDGGWEWLKCNWPPMEHDDHYGATLAAIAVGAAPGDYARTAVAKKGMIGIREYLARNPGENLHHRAMVLWASSYHEGLLSDQEKQACIDDLFTLQLGDGGWAIATLGDWARDDGTRQNRTTSDGYGTGFVLFILRRSGVAKDDPRIVNGVAWLKTNQRESGRWISRSLFRDNKHFLSHAGTAFAVMALATCDP